MSKAAPSHTDLLGAYAELNGDLTALRARFSLSGLQLIAFLEDPAILPRLTNLNTFLLRSTITRLQTISVDALVSSINSSNDPIERRRAATMLARLTLRCGRLPPAPRPRSALSPTAVIPTAVNPSAISPAAMSPTAALPSPIHSSPSSHPFPTAGAPSSIAPTTPIATSPPPTNSLPKPIAIDDIPIRPADATLPQPITTHFPIKAPKSPLVKVAPHFSLVVKAGQAPVARASSP